MASQDLDRDLSVKWVHPERALDAEHKQVLTEQQVARWTNQGYALVDGVLPLSLIGDARSIAVSGLPTPGSPEAETITDFGSSTDSHLNFPSQTNHALNEITLHSRLLSSVAQLLKCHIHQLRLTQSQLWPKYGRQHRIGELDNSDQRIHCDYPNHTLTHPPPWNSPEAVEIIIYMDQVETSGGATAVVPRQGDNDPAYTYPIVNMPGVGTLLWKNDRASVEAYLAKQAPLVEQFRREHLYPREARVKFGVGTVLFYRHDTWHRGTPLVPSSLRVVVNLTFRHVESEWITTIMPGWAWSMYDKTQYMEKLIAHATPQQRAVLGFPMPGHKFWTTQTIIAVTARYQGMGFDPQPYLDALPHETTHKTTTTTTLLN